MEQIKQFINEVIEQMQDIVLDAAWDIEDIIWKGNDDDDN